VQAEGVSFYKGYSNVLLSTANEHPSSTQRVQSTESPSYHWLLKTVSVPWS